MQQGLVISDLHLFSRRSVAEELLEGIKGDIIAADVLVLNGDMFDFRWSALPDMKATIAASFAWLDELTSLRVGKHTHYLLGNHDCVSPFTDMLPPSNRLEALKDSRAGQHSIRINGQWRLCFRWDDGNASEVEITDYH